MPNTHPNRSLTANERSMNQPIQWVHICRALTVMGLMECSKQEAFRVNELLQARIAAGKVKRVKRGLYQLVE